jgi:hypothetical protein
VNPLHCVPIEHPAQGLSAAASVLPAGTSPATYRRHALHGDERIWVEKNCYIDLWIALTHSLGLQPLAMLGVTAGIDFLGDQWTFFKPSHDDLRRAYGIDVQELTLWRPLREHVLEHLGAGRLVSVEADAFWLPDTAATDYRAQHAKTTIVVAACDPAARQLTYFHNAGLFRLEGEDFDATLASGGLPLPLFAEVVCIDRRVVRDDAALRALARQRLADHLAWRPAHNPVLRFAGRFATELPWLQHEGLATYHAWAFANTRQLGAAMELLALHLRWLGGLDAAAADFEAVAQGCKTLILKAARAVAGRRPLDAADLFDTMAGAWERGMASLEAAQA